MFFCICTQFKTRIFLCHTLVRSESLSKSGALLPILVSINRDIKGIQVLSIIISIAIAISIALEEAFKFKEKYIKPEGLINIINNLKGDFISKENDFANLTDQQRNIRFASLSSRIILNSQNSLLEAFSNMESLRKKTENNHIMVNMQLVHLK